MLGVLRRGAANVDVPPLISVFIFIHHPHFPFHVCFRPVREPLPQPCIYLNLFSHLFLLVSLSTLRLLCALPTQLCKGCGPASGFRLVPSQAAFQSGFLTNGVGIPLTAQGIHSLAGEKPAC
jgi:hypothetical protein